MRLNVVASRVEHQHAPGRKYPGEWWNDDFRNPQLGGQCSGVKCATATEGHEREVARIMATIDRNQFERVDHVGVGDLQHTMSQ
ncbi:hypothetical protein D3C76_1140550 [compost metagenome]